MHKMSSEIKKSEKNFPRKCFFFDLLSSIIFIFFFPLPIYIIQCFIYLFTLFNAQNELRNQKK